MNIAMSQHVYVHTSAIFSTWTSANVLKTDVSFRPTARLNERESLKSECKRRIVVSLYLSTAATYVRSSRVILDNFAHRFQCMYIQKDLSQLTTFFLVFFSLYKLYSLQSLKTFLLIVLWKCFVELISLIEENKSFNSTRFSC